MIYETDSDRENQEQAAWMLEYMGYGVKHSSTKAGYDFALTCRGKPHALVEFKQRKKQYTTLNIDCTKIDKLIELAVDHGVLPVLLVKWEEIGGYWFWRCKQNVPKDIMKRYRQGETADEVYCIPIKDFTLM